MLELKHLTFSVEGEGSQKEILKDVSLNVQDGTFLVVTGPNGGGKTTLAKTIMGLNQPTSGQIIWNGEDITNLNITERARRGISYGFQQPPRFKGLRVWDLLSLASGNAQLTHAEGCQLLTQVGLCAADYIDREVDNSLSGGEVKRIEIATILARKSPLMIFDEPEAGIDLWSFAKLSPRRASTCGALPSSPRPSATSTTSGRPPSLSSPTRSASSTWPTRSS